jgi:hypothetical protein
MLVAGILKCALGRGSPAVQQYPGFQCVMRTERRRRARSPIVLGGCSMRYVAILAALVAALSGCSATSGGGGGERPDSNVITAEEIAETGALNAYEAVERLRRRWFTPHGATSLQEPKRLFPKVFVDNLEYGELDSLRSIRVAEIWEIRFIDGRGAVNRYGMEYGAGIIMVITR